MAKSSILFLNDNASGLIAADARKMLLKAGFSESDIDLFTETLTGLLDDYAAAFGEKTKVQYTIWKTLMKIELRIKIPGKAFDPFSEGDGARERTFENLFNLNVDNAGAGISYKYAMRCNIISISIPLAKKPRKFIKDPVIWGVIAGVLLGFCCKLLPPETNQFVINELASPLQSIVLNVISGIMGPVIFFSLISSIGALSSVNDLTHLGFKIIGRFLVIILFLIVVSIAVSGLVFQNFGPGSIDFSPSQLFRLILDVIPTNLIDPFLKNNTAQLVILGLLCGAALLLLGDSVSTLKRNLDQINKWVMSIMRLVLLLLPAVPCLSIMISIASGKERDLLSGWKFIVASYIAFAVCAAVKAVKTSLRSGVGFRNLWRYVKPVAMVSLTTGSTTASIKRIYEVSDEDVHVKKSFSSFWIPMSTAMLSPKTAVNVVIAAFMAAQLENVPISTAFLMILIIIATELSTASPGIPAACTVMLKTLGLPLNYVGLITTYRLLTDNFGAACSASYTMMEEVEIAHKLGVIETDESVSPEPDENVSPETEKDA